jgi:hypothetical protein
MNDIYDNSLKHLAMVIAQRKERDGGMAISLPFHRIKIR